MCDGESCSLCVYIFLLSSPAGLVDIVVFATWIGTVFWIFVSTVHCSWFMYLLLISLLFRGQPRHLYSGEEFSFCTM